MISGRALLVDFLKPEPPSPQFSFATFARISFDQDCIDAHESGGTPGTGIAGLVVSASEQRLAGSGEDGFRFGVAIQSDQFEANVHAGLDDG